jgi:hypothetical protein
MGSVDIMKSHFGGYESFDYVQRDAVADMLEAYGHIFPDGPEHPEPGKAVEQYWSYLLPDGKVVKRDNRRQAAADVIGYYSGLMRRREETESGLDAWQVEHEAEINIGDPFHELLRALAKMEVLLFCRSKNGMPRCWPARFKDFIEALTKIVRVFNGFLVEPNPVGHRDRHTSADLGEEMDRRKSAILSIIEAQAKGTDERNRVEIYKRTSELFDGLYYVVWPLYQLFFSPRPTEDTSGEGA